jgi:hypothetical protein
MAEPTNEPASARRRPAPGAPLEYRSPGPEPRSQWLTDDQVYGACLVYALLVLAAGASAIGLVAWLVWTALGWL